MRLGPTLRFTRDRRLVQPGPHAGAGAGTEAHTGKGLLRVGTSLPANRFRDGLLQRAGLSPMPLPGETRRTKLLRRTVQHLRKRSATSHLAERTSRMQTRLLNNPKPLGGSRRRDLNITTGHLEMGMLKMRRRPSSVPRPPAGSRRSACALSISPGLVLSGLIPTRILRRRAIYPIFRRRYLATMAHRMK